MLNRYSFLRINLTLLLLVALATSSCKKNSPDIPEIPDSPTGSKPNIILVLGDDVGYEVPDFTGGQSYSTPNMDALANQGMLFTRCFGSPMCAPSRFMLLTGKYNFRNYGPNSWGDLGLDQKTVANMLQDKGYTTCVAGKWQFNHGDTAMTTFGFDKYCITNPFKVASEDNSADLRLYKNPTIYENGAYLPDSQMLGKYSEDIFLSYMFDFIDSSTQAKKPFFIYYAPNLCHKPFSPTPDDPQFASWNPDKPESDDDTTFFRSMLTYYDKDIGKLISKLNELNISQNTLILFLIGDNGTEDRVTSKYHGKYVKGGKGHTYYTGIHLPLVAYWPGHISPGQNGSIVDFVDFLPTIANAAGVSTPTNYGTLDGLSFYDEMFDKSVIDKRKYSYNWYDVNRFGPDSIPPAVWAMDKDYKLYSNQTDLIDVLNDPLERDPITAAAQSSNQVKQRVNLQATIDSYHN